MACAGFIHISRETQSVIVANEPKLVHREQTIQHKHTLTDALVPKYKGFIRPLISMF